jgi:hypothetical protein
MYNIVLLHTSGSTITRRADSPFSVLASYTVQSFTDATGAPGICPPAVPPFATTYQTWRFGSSTLTWSDRINAPTTECTLIQPTKTNGTQPEYLVSSCDGRPYYLYNYACLAIIGESLCPTPWRWASLNDYASIGTLTAEDLALDTWDICPYFDRGSWLSETAQWEWSSSPWGGNWGTAIFEANGTYSTYHNGNKAMMNAIRCVK